MSGFLRFIAISSCLILLSSAVVSSQQMNVLFIAVDDLKPKLGCYGDTLAVTPNIDQLAAEGIIFTHAYCQQAVCAPSRASLLTSRYPDQTGVLDLQTMMRDVHPEITSLPEYLIGKGYETSATGKIFDFRSVDEGMDTPSWSRPYQSPYKASYYDPVNGRPAYFYASDFSKDTIAKLEKEAGDLGLNKATYVKENYHPSVEYAEVRYDGYIDGAILNAGVEVLEELAGGDKPFFLGVGFHRPHLPFVAPKQYWDLYERSLFQPAAFQEHAANSPDLAYHNFDELRAYTDIPLEGNLSEEKQLELIHGYYAAASYVDDLIGRLLAQLDTLGIKENTIIVLWGDHGWHLGDHNLWCKHSNFEQATRAPLLFRIPDQPMKGAVCESPVEFTDIAPTICELNQVQIPQFFEGESLLPLFSHPDARIRYGAFSQYPRWGGRMGYTLRSDRYRYTKWIDDEGMEVAREFYDYLTDPEETVSAVEDMNYSEIIAEMDSVLSRRIKIPSTQTHITFRLNGINAIGDTLLLDAASIRFQDEEQLSDDSGIALFTHLPGNYLCKASSRGYIPDTFQVNIEADTLIDVYLEQDSFTATLQLIKQWDNLYLENAEVHLAGQTLVSDENGIVVFPGLSYANYQVEVYYSNGKSQVFDNFEVYSDTLISLILIQPTYAFTIEVMDYFSGYPISGVETVFGAQQKLTNINGLAEFITIEGEYPLRLSRQFYDTIWENVFFSEARTLQYFLIPTHNTAEIWIKKGQTPISGAEVTMNTEQKVTLGLGLAKFENIPIRQHYQYVVEKTGYMPQEGEFFLVGDTSIVVQMTPLATTEMFSEQGDLLIWPNPVKVEFSVLIPAGEENGLLTIRSMEGRIVLNVPVELKRKLNINVADFKPGCYALSYTSASCAYQSLILKL